jgi:hypothetical protein
VKDGVAPGQACFAAGGANDHFARDDDEVLGRAAGVRARLFARAGGEAQLVELDAAGAVDGTEGAAAEAAVLAGEDLALAGAEEVRLCALACGEEDRAGDAEGAATRHSVLTVAVLRPSSI